MFAILPLAQCGAFSLVNCCAAQLKLIQHYYVLPTCLKTPRSFLNFPAEIGLVDELRLCFKDYLFFQNNVVLYHNYGNMTVVYPKVSNQYISIFHDVCQRRIQYITNVYEKCMTCTYPLKSCILCYIHILLHLMLQSGNISCFLF